MGFTGEDGNPVSYIVTFSRKCCLSTSFVVCLLIQTFQDVDALSIFNVSIWFDPCRWGQTQQ